MVAEVSLKDKGLFSGTVFHGAVFFKKKKHLLGIKWVNMLGCQGTIFMTKSKITLKNVL